MGELVPLAQHVRPVHQKRHPFGLKVPRSPEWPPYQYALVPGTKKVTRKRGAPWYQWLVDLFGPLIPADYNDLQTFAQTVARKLRNLGIIVEEDIRASYESNLKYSHYILQYVEAVGRAAENELVGHGRDIRALNHHLAADVARLDHELVVVRKNLEAKIKKGDAAAVTKAVHISQKWTDKVWGHKVDLTYGWFKNRDVWFRDRVTKWWKVIYREQIRPIKTTTNNHNVQIGLIWATINAEVRPALKVVAKAGSWLKWFAHWKRDALLAFGTLKAGEVAHWLEQQYERPAK